MRGKKCSVGVRAALAIFALTMFVTTVCATAEKGLPSFNGPDGDGIDSYAGLIFDAAGNLYGTTISEGAHGWGTAFELIPKAGGGWREKVLHGFGEGEDGFQPYYGLIIDASGNLYGTTTFVGTYNNKHGTVFELTPEASGAGRTQCA